MDKERFSLLLLEPGEIYFEDFSAVLIPNDASKRQDGRLKLCSRSIVFDPKDILSPLLKIPLKECTVIEELRESLALKLEGKGGITLECNHHVQMLEGNIVAPYTFKFEKQRFNFLLNYARASNCLAQFAQLHRASSLPIAEQNTMLAAITFSRQSRMVFDSLWLDDLYEQRVFETQGNRITPLVVNPGHILLTNEVLYYQPFNNVETLPVVKIRLKDVRRVVKRRFLLQHVGLEVYCCDGSPVPHLFLALKSVDERDKLYNGLLAQCGPYLDDSKQEAITLKWQHGVLSNYDYILYLNSLADRTFNDLTQYPVFPWVVADYQSSKLDLNAFKTFRDLRKPIGALNEERLKKLRDRYDEMPEPKFMYGSHYSTPGFVLFYLVRKFPHYMLCLQNGRFDHPDRMFNSVPDVWRNVLGNPSDFKELVPEFYDIQGGGDFLTNTFGINFGYRHDGTKVGNVALPPWAAGPADFVQKLRDALESDYVSENLHSWIDLIFGYKQTGEEAIKANNVFYHLCYEGSVDLSTVTDPARRHALEVQIMEFGQIPRQILDCPHPKRIIHRPNAGLAVCAVSGPMSNEGGGDQPKQFEYVVAFSGHRECVRAVNILEAGQAVASVGNDGLLKVHSLVEHRLLHSVALATTPLSSVVPLPGHHRIAAGSFDNSVVFYDLQFGRILDRLVAHEDAVSCLAWGSKSATNDSLLVTGSWDCSARVWRKIPIGDSEWRPIRPANTLAAELDHDARVVCLAISSDEKYLVTGCEDGGLFLWFLDTHSLYQTLPGHLGPVGAVAIGNNVQQLVSCGVSDRTLKVFDIPSGMPVCCKELNQDLRCLAWVGPAVLVGGSAGMLQVWDLLHVEIVQEISAHKGAVTAVAMSSDGSILVTGGEDCQVIVWK